MSGSVWNGILGFFAYAVLAVAAQNAVFTRALGVSRLVRIVEDGSIELIRRAETLDDYFATLRYDGSLM